MKHPSRLCPLTLITLALLCGAGCAVPRSGPLPSSTPPIPEAYPGSPGGTNAVVVGWREFFHDPVLADLISAALTNNQEINVVLQEVAVAKAESDARKGAVFPFVRLGGRAGVDKVGKKTRNGAVEENLDIEPGRRFPEPLTDFGVVADFDWEMDIWRKLRNERDAAVQRYLATREGRRFMVTHLVSEIAESYYELLALDSQLAILRRMIEVQGRALESVRLKKSAGRLTELAVRRFEAEVFKNRSRVFALEQQITVTENRLNVLAGRYPQPIPRGTEALEPGSLEVLEAGLPASLLANRPDILQAERELTAAGLEVKAAAARFYPSVDLSAALGLESFTLGSPILAKENLLYGAAANLAGPLVNRSAIRAAFNGAQAHQVAAIYRYQQAVLKAYVEVANELSRIRNVDQGYELKGRQVAAMAESAVLSSQLFDSARADYTEVLLTQREALEAEMEAVDTRLEQLVARIRTYKAIGGGVSEKADAAAVQAAAPAAPSR